MIKRKCQVLEEITEWDKTDVNIPNHTYFVDCTTKRLVAYRSAITGTTRTFAGKGLQFDRRFRKFKNRGVEYT
jgi:hypothetical protein